MRFTVFLAHSDNQMVSILEWIGDFHTRSIHFPIALVIMAAIATVLYLLTSSIIYSHASKFMIVAAALTALVSVALGLAHSYSEVYDGEILNTFWWHRFYGLSTTALTIMAAALNYFFTKSKTFYLFLFIAVILVILTGHFGGELAAHD